MRHYIKALKGLDDVPILHVDHSEFEGIPDEVLRIIRSELGISIVKGPKMYHCWPIHPDISALESFTGRYGVGEDDIGIFWERRPPGGRREGGH